MFNWTSKIDIESVRIAENAVIEFLNLPETKKYIPGCPDFVLYDTLPYMRKGEKRILKLALKHLVRTRIILTGHYSSRHGNERHRYYKLNGRKNTYGLKPAKFDPAKLARAKRLLEIASREEAEKDLHIRAENWRKMKDWIVG